METNPREDTLLTVDEVAEILKVPQGWPTEPGSVPYWPSYVSRAKSGT
jgi:hypothetical protein